MVGYAYVAGEDVRLVRMCMGMYVRGSIYMYITTQGNWLDKRNGFD
jgi:hypothetical protein